MSNEQVTSWCYAIMVPVCGAWIATLIQKRQWRWVGAASSMLAVLIPLAVMAAARCWK